MRKVLVVALREYTAAVRTRAFLIGLMVMPLMMGGSILVQKALEGYRDFKEKTVAVLDRTPKQSLLGALQQAADLHNQYAKDPETGKTTAAPFKIEPLPVPTSSDDLEKERKEISAQVRLGKYAGFLEIAPGAAKLQQVADPAETTIHYLSRRLTEREFITFAQATLSARIRQLRSVEAGLPVETVEKVSRPITIETESPSIIVPLISMMLMFMLMLMAATPLMQGVVEEKMQRIAEVLLGSLSPFQLMLGKLFGMTAVSLTMGAVYLSGAYWAAWYFGMDAEIPLSLLGWFVLYQTLATLMFGSLFIAVGAACTDMRETQNLLWPVMLLATMPMFMLGPVLRDPGSNIVTAISMVPFATPMLMIARQSVPPGVPIWQPIVGVAGMVLTTLLCVWIAGRIFRVGILMMGKGATPAELLKWIVRG